MGRCVKINLVVSTPAHNCKIMDLSSFINGFGGSVNSMLQNKNNERIMQKQMDFASNEASKARRETSVSSQIQQMKANGINAAAQGSVPVSQGSPAASSPQAIPNVGYGINDLGLAASQPV